MRWRTSRGASGLLDEGLASAELAAAERARLFGPRSREHALSLVTVGKALLAQGRVEEAGKRFEEAVAHFESAGEARSVDCAAALSGRAEVHMLTENLPGAIADERLAFEITAAALGETDPETLEHLSNIAVLQTESGTFAEAVTDLSGDPRRTRARRRRRFSESPERRAQSRHGARLGG